LQYCNIRDDWTTFLGTSGKPLMYSDFDFNAQCFCTILIWTFNQNVFGYIFIIALQNLMHSATFKSDFKYSIEFEFTCNVIRNYMVGCIFTYLFPLWPYALYYMYSESLSYNFIIISLISTSRVCLKHNV